MASQGDRDLLGFRENDPHRDSDEQVGKLLCSYLGLSFAVFLGLLPRNSTSLVSSLQSKNKALSFKLLEAEEELRQLRCRMKEDSKANARVVEIFASHRHAWQLEEKRLCQQIDECNEEIAFLKGKIEDFERADVELKARIDDLNREVSDKDEMLKFMSRAAAHCDDLGEMGYGKAGASGALEYDTVEEIGSVYCQSNCGFSPPEYSHHPASKFWSEKASLWQDMQLETAESHYQMKHVVSRRESPWKMDGEESNGVASKMKLLEQDLLDLGAICKGSNGSKLASQLRKQAKRYRTLSCKLEDLCHRMQDPHEASLLNPEFRTQRQTEFLREAFRLQQSTSEAGQKLMGLQSQMGRCQMEDGLGDGPRKLALRRAHLSLKEVQRNLEIWLARIIGDVEGILARDSSGSRGRDYCLSRYPFPS